MPSRRPICVVGRAPSAFQPSIVARKVTSSLSSGALEHLDEEVLLAAEHAHDVGLADAGRLGDLVGGRAEVAALAEDQARGVEDLLAALAGGMRSLILSVTLDRLSVDY